jgi:hypothetical protein
VIGNTLVPKLELGNQHNLTTQQNVLEIIYFRGKTSVNSNYSARTQENTPRHYAPCKATPRYRFNCHGAFCDSLGHVDYDGLVDAKELLSSFSASCTCLARRDSLLSAAPKQSEALSGSAGSALSVLGKNNNAYGNLAGLASTFKRLNLSPDRVDEFVPVVVDYVSAKSGALTANMLQSVLYGGL